MPDDPPCSDSTAHAGSAQPDVTSLLARLRAAKNAPEELATLLDVWTRRRYDDPVWPSSPEPYRYLGERFWKLGVAPMAREVASAALVHSLNLAGREQRPWEHDAELRLINGLALARTANPDQAQQVLWKLHDETTPNDVAQLDAARRRVREETLGMLGRTYKDQAIVADAALRAELWRKSLELYDRAYRLTGGYWTGINVATLARLSGDDDRAAQVA